MLKFLKEEANWTVTENGDAAYRSTQSECLDLFATIGALRGAEDREILDRFRRAYAEDRDLAMKTLFYARDVRGGLGERRVFRVVLKWLADNEPLSVKRNIPLVAEYGRFDDLLVLLDTACGHAVLQYLKRQLEADCAALRKGGSVSLLAKWLPSVNASCEETVRQAKRIARALHMGDAQYRRTLSALRAHLRLLENDLRRREYGFKYQDQPAKALFKYRKAFLRNDGERYASFLRRAAAKQATLHTAGLAPYELIRPFFGGGPVEEAERRAIDATWNALEDFTNGENALVVVDGSGSMYGGADPLPAAVALSLGIYYAQRNTGVFHGHFITFSEHPRLVEIRGRDIFEQVRYCMQFQEIANTDLQRVFQLILRTAVRHRVPQAELPSRIYVISDMEFDRCAVGVSRTSFACAKDLFARHGYRLPEVVFWNVASRGRHQPVTRSEAGVTLVSGCSPSVFAMIRDGIPTPCGYMRQVLGSRRYAPVAA